jgi:hypothetical protein
MHEQQRYVRREGKDEREGCVDCSDGLMRAVVVWWCGTVEWRENYLLALKKMPLCFCHEANECKNLLI